MKSETNIQRELWKLIEAFRIPGVIIFHIPNGEKRDIRTAVRLKEMGVMPGVPDFIFHVGGVTGYLELKRTDGRRSDSQKAFFVAAWDQKIKVDIAYSEIEGALILQERGVLDPSIKFKLSDDPSAIVRARGRTGRRIPVRPTSEGTAVSA